MTNKFRRSLTSVLLAASLLFSSQSVVAFADYGSKSDASDLSPVQESVENATEEQQEDPSLSVEPVIGESTEAPVAAPMMARANAPVSYSAPRLDDYHTYFEENYPSDFASIAVYTRVPNSIEADGKQQENAFMQGSGWQVYEALPVEGWIFKGWSYSLTENDNTEDLGNIYDEQLFIKRYTFSDADSNWYAPYDISSSNYERISINALTRGGALGNGVSVSSVLHHSIYANYNPLVTVEYDENQGTVTSSLTSHTDPETKKIKYEAEYGNSATFTITPNDGYKVASVTADGIVIPVDENGKCTLPPVTEPTTLKVEFEKAEDEDTITKDKIDGDVIVTVACDNLPEHTRQYSLSVNGTDDGEYPNYKITKTSDESATLHLLKDGWLHTFVSQPGHEGHSLVDSSSNYINIKLTFDEASGKWKLPNPDDWYDVTIDVKCTSKIPEPSTPDVTDLDSLFLEGVTVKCSEKDNHTKSYHFKDIDADNYNNAFYTVTKPELQDGGKYLSILTVKNQAYVDRYNMSTFPEEPHKLNAKNEQTFNLVWDGIKWSCEESTSIGISVTCGIPDPKPSDLAGVQVKLECVNDATHNQTIGFDWLSSEDYYTVTRDENDPTKATVSIEQQSINWVNNSNTVGKPQHVLYSAANNSISLTYKDEKWELDYPNNVFCIKVLCPPTDLIMDKLNVSVQCAEKADHELQTFDMIADTFTATVKQNTDNEYVCELTVNSEKYVELYNSRHPGHVPAVPATVVPLKYTGSAWEVIVGKETIPFVVSCEAPDAPTTDEVSIMGKLLTLDCITENVNHSDVSYNLDRGTFTVGEVYTQNTIMPLSDNTTVPAATYHVNVTVNRTSYYLNQYNNVYGTHTLAAGNPVEPIVVLEYNGTEWTPINNARLEVEHEVTTPGGGGEGTNPGGNGGDNDDDDDRYTGGNTVTRTINDDDVPLNDRPTNTTTIDDEDVPLADLPDDTVTIDDGEVPLKANPSTGDSLPFAAMAAAALSLGGVIVLNRKKK